MPRHFLRIFVIAALLAPTAPALWADAVSDALQAATDAYASGDLAKTSAELTMAGQALAARQSSLLATLLPEAPEGWTRTMSEDYAQGFGMMGGGSGAEARYDIADGSVSFTMNFIADSPMVASMGAMLGNVQMMAMMGKVVKVGDQALLDSDNNLSTLVANRVLFTAQGATTEQMMPFVKLLDFARIGVFDGK